jgi:predicted ATP-dependent endonuclease of OLD family
LSNQSILTTHSPQIASYFRPNEINIIRNLDGELKAIPLLTPNESIPDKNALMRLYTIYRAEICEALMNRVVLLPEGITEYLWIKSLINALITAEGWTGISDDSTSSQIGILPTQNSNMENTYSAFQHLIDTIIPLVDGDSAGNEYVKALSKMTKCPGRILQLPAGWDLEKTIAWIIGNSEDSIPKDLQKFFTGHSSLHEALTMNKSNWDIHEKIVQFISEDSTCLNRAKCFVNSLCSLSITGAVKNWEIDSKRSTSTTSVLVFDPS